MKILIAIAVLLILVLAILYTRGWFDDISITDEEAQEIVELSLHGEDVLNPDEWPEDG